MATFNFELVSPEELLISTEVDGVQLPGSEGEFEILAGHAPFLALLGPGIMTVSGGDVEHRRLFIDGGFCDVGPGGCTVLAEAAIPAGESAEKLDKLIEAAEEEAQSLEGDPLDQATRRLATLKTARASL